jgi:hypothetical protein
MEGLKEKKKKKKEGTVEVKMLATRATPSPGSRAVRSNCGTQNFLKITYLSTKNQSACAMNVQTKRRTTKY